MESAEYGVQEEVVSDQPKGRQGFASMPAGKVSAIARQGGRAAHRLGRAHQWTQEEARAAARRSVEKRRGTRVQEAA
jgi:hypothetical protein